MMENFIHNKFGYCFYSAQENSAVIFNLYVHPEYRRQGEGKKLLAYVISEIREIYSGEIDVEVVPRENSISINRLLLFYQNMGLRALNHADL